MDCGMDRDNEENGKIRDRGILCNSETTTPKQVSASIRN